MQALAIVAGASCLLPAAAVAAPVSPVTVYVSPSGNDRAAGGPDNPLQTLAAAQAKVRELPRTAPITVRLAPGVYRPADTLVFTAADSGSEKAPITWEGAGWKQTVVSGGRPVTGWHPSEADPRVWQASVPAGTEFHQLWVNGRRATRARTPNKDYLYFDTPGSYRRGQKLPTDANGQPKYFKDGFAYRSADAAAWEAAAKAPDALVAVFHSWTASMHWIKEVRSADQRVVFRNPASGNSTPIGQWGLRGKYEKNQRYVLENYREALDSPGEWFLDSKTGTVWYWPQADEQLATAEVIAPALGEIVRIEPAKDKVVSHLHFKGISFQHQDWNFDRDHELDRQAFSMAMASGVRAFRLVKSSFEDCEFTRIGTHGLWLEEGCQDNLVTRCHVHDTGGGGIYIGPGGEFLGQEVPVTAPEMQKVQRNVVDNCYVHDITHLLRGSIGIWVGCAAYNKITHNEVSDFDYTGISVGWTWTRRKDLFLHSNLVEFNRIHHTTKEILSDNAGVYVLGWAPDSVVARNVIHDIYHYPNNDFSRALYLDGNSSCYLFEQNVCYRLGSFGIMIKGEYNRVLDNIFADARRAAIIRAFIAAAKEFNYDKDFFQRNLFYLPTKNMMEGMNAARWSQYDHNLYWSTSVGADVRFYDRSYIHDPAAQKVVDATFAQWQAIGQDAGSVVADPLFTAPEQGNFRLRPDSPAKSIGFREWDHAQAGLYGDPAWTSLPQSYPIPALELSPVMQRALEKSEKPFE